jgi:hypothetical protein
MKFRNVSDGQEASSVVLQKSVAQVELIKGRNQEIKEMGLKSLFP